MHAIIVRLFRAVVEYQVQSLAACQGQWERIPVWFRKKDRLSDVPPQLRGAGGPDDQKPAFYRIEYEMMKKGAQLHRRGRPIRQFAVTVDMCTRVVTSGDVVDRATYQALVAAGAVESPQDTERESATEPHEPQHSDPADAPVNLEE
jgi:hypothetical protein